MNHYENMSDKVRNYPKFVKQTLSEGLCFTDDIYLIK